MPRPVAILTDFDRTLTFLYRDRVLLAELSELVQECYSVVIDQTSLTDLPEDGYLAWHELNELAREHLPAPDAEKVNLSAGEVVARFEHDRVSAVGPLPGVSAAVQKLHHSGFRIGLVSSNDADVIRYFGEKYGLAQCFEHIEGRPKPLRADLLKPNPYQILMALSAMRLRPEEAWYVGDDIVDVQAALRADVLPIGVASGHHTRQSLVDAGAGMVFRTFAEFSESALGMTSSRQ